MMTKEYFRSRINMLMMFKSDLTPTVLESIKGILEEESWRDNSDCYQDLAKQVNEALMDEGYHSFFQLRN